MTITQAFILGIVQGVSEFLPISSSGHLVVFQNFLGVTTPPILFDILVHVGTLVAVLIYFRNQLLSIFQKHFTKLVIGTIPAVIVGLVVYSQALSIFDSLLVASIGFLLTSTILFVSARSQHNSTSLDSITVRHALIIGLFQSAAILPGLSRSGSTIAAGLMLGLTKASAFTFSFILSIPAILGALVLSLKDITQIDQSLYLPSLIGFVTALITGIASLRLLDLILRKKDLMPFAFYTLAIGSLLLGLIV